MTHSSKYLVVKGLQVEVCNGMFLLNMVIYPLNIEIKIILFKKKKRS